MSLIEDTDWKHTLIVNLERAVGASIVWAIVRAFGWLPNEWSPIGVLFGFPFFYFFGLLPLGLIGIKLQERGVSWVGLAGTVASVAILAGDPLVYALSKAAPHLVPVSDFKLFNRVLILLVQKNDEPAVDSPAKTGPLSKKVDPLSSKM